jgi:hypothetical protein
VHETIRLVAAGASRRRPPSPSRLRCQTAWQVREPFPPNGRPLSRIRAASHCSTRGACLPPPPRAHVALRWSEVVAPRLRSLVDSRTNQATTSIACPKGAPISAAQIRLFPNSRAPPPASPLLPRTHAHPRVAFICSAGVGWLPSSLFLSAVQHWRASSRGGGE